MQETKGSEERRISRTERSEGEVVNPVEPPQAAGPQQQINGNISHSQVRLSMNQTPHVPQVPMTFRVAAKEPSGTNRPTTASGSSQRKRSRIGDEGLQVTTPSLTKIQDYTTAMNGHIETLQKHGQKGNTGLIRIQMTDCMREIVGEITNVLAKMINTQDQQIGFLKTEKQLKDKIVSLQEENLSIKKQVIELQMKILNREQEEKNEAVPSYAQMVNKNIVNNIVMGRQLPLPQVPQSVKHAPSECIILFKSEVKGEMKSKQEQEVFRKEVRDTLNKEEMQMISAIRPTRFGGHTLIFYNEKSRDQAFSKLRRKEEERGIQEADSKMVAPTKRVAKIVCKEVPGDISIEQIKVDMYGKHNPILQTVNNVHRMGKIYRTRLGLIFELSSHEMAAIQSQGWKIRCDLGRELKVEEFISLQQCYACCKFGHSAAECKATEETCRLCGKIGHAGKDCDEKNNKDAWSCANCLRMNQAKNLNLDTKHAAAQLHKCPVAQQQKNIRKIQLASTGVFTTPIQKGDDLLGSPNDGSVKRSVNGAQEFKRQNEARRKARSRSVIRNLNNRSTSLQQRTDGVQRQTAGREMRKKSSEDNPCVQRSTKTTREQSNDGWQIAGRRKQRESESSMGGRRSTMQIDVSGEGQRQEEEEEMMELMSEAHDTDDEDL